MGIRERGRKARYPIERDSATLKVFPASASCYDKIDGRLRANSNLAAASIDPP
jgi:hypothetical protein